MSLKGPFLDFVDKNGIDLPKEATLDAKSSQAFDADFMNHFQAPSFGSTGIIARDEKDGSVWHARNFGIALPQFLQKLSYNGRFTKNGKEVFTGNMVFPSPQVFTGVRRGKNGYSFQLNQRYTKSLADTPVIMK